MEFSKTNPSDDQNQNAASLILNCSNPKAGKFKKEDHFFGKLYHIGENELQRIPYGKFEFYDKGCLLLKPKWSLFPQKVQNIVLLNNTAWVNFKPLPERGNSLIFKIRLKSKKDTEKSLSCQYEVEEAWKRVKNDQVLALKHFLNGKALLLVRIKSVLLYSPPTYELTTMILKHHNKPKYVINTGIKIQTSKGYSRPKSITEVLDVLVTGRHGNLVILRVSKIQKRWLMLFAFSPNGAKILSRSHAEVSTFDSIYDTLEVRAGPDSRLLYLFASCGHLLVYEILHERYLALRTKYALKQKIMSRYGIPTISMINLEHIFCYSEKQIIVLMRFKDSPRSLKLFVLTYDEEKRRVERNAVENAQELKFDGDIKLYRKNGKVYFYDLKQSVFNLTLQ